MKRLLLATSILAASWMHVPAAMAQTDAPAEGASASDDARGAPDIIVTANRRSESEQRLAIPLDVVSEAELDRQGITNVENLNRLVPGLGLANSGTITQIYLRGVGTFAGPVGDSSVLASFDGVTLGQNVFLGGSFYDLQRVEVLKGPQGTLYGRNATAGAINLIPNRPGPELGAGFNAEVGNYDAVKLDGFANLPVSEQLSFRLSGQFARHDGYFTDGGGSEKNHSVRLQALFKPSDTVSLLVSGQYADLGGTGNSFVPFPFVDPDRPFLGASDPRVNARLQGDGPPIAFRTPGDGFNYLIRPDGRADAKTYGVHAELNIDLGFATFTAIPAYRSFDTIQAINPGFQIASVADGDQTTLEARFASNEGSAFKWIVGGYYYDSATTETDIVEQGTFRTTIFRDETTRAYAAFGEATVSLTDWARVTGGLRYTDERRTQVGNADVQRQVFGPPGMGIPGMPTPPGFGDYVFAGRVGFSNVTYKAGVEFDLAPSSLLYATLATGFRSGGLNFDVAPNVFRPEKLTSYTIGAKNRFFDNRLRVNIEGFYWDYKNHQENILTALNASPPPPLPGIVSVITRNIGKSTVKGVDLDIEFRPTPRTVLSFQVEYLDATFDEFNFVSPLSIGALTGTTSCGLTQIPSMVPLPPPPFGPPPQFTGTTRVNCDGKPFTRAPEFTAIVGVQQSFPLANGSTIIAGANANIASSSFLATDYIADERQGSYAIFGADLTYAGPDDRWSVTGFVRNLTDEAVRTAAFQRPFIPGLVYSSLRPPRTYGVQARVKF